MPGGRPTDYKSEYEEQAYKLCLLGATDKELGDFFEVTEQTINNWKKQVPQFFESIKSAKENADAEVAKSLNEKARGYRYTKMQPIKVKEVTYENGKRIKEIERVEIVPTEEVVPPDTVAGIFWLKNRRKINWRDRVETEHSGHVIHKFEDMDDEQLDRAIQARKDRAS
jgi:hypothetical protein